jgi:FKBP-type peptidyl-prolyl cis-trans isomerase
MRRASALLVIPVLAAFAAVGCSSSPSSSSPAASSSSANDAVTATGAFGTAPKVTIPAEQANDTLTVKTLIQGSGPVLGSSDEFLGNYVAYVWNGKTHKQEISTYTSAPQLLTDKLLPGLETAVVGKPMGSRILAVIPPKDGFGTSGNSQAGVTGSDTLVFVMDLIQKFGATQSATGTQVSNGGGDLPSVSAKPGSAPVVTIPKNSPPASLVTKVLIKGSGAPVTKGQLVVVQYTGVNWRTGKVFDSSWSRSEPFGFTIDDTPEQVIPGWDKGLTGQTVGSRVLLVIPPADGYGKSGASQVGIKGTDTLVFVVDILGAVNS